MLDIVLYVFLTAVVFIATGLIKQASTTNKLIKEFRSFGCEALIVTTEEIELDEQLQNEDTQIKVVSSIELINSNNFYAKVMKKIGVQQVPFKVWISERGVLEGKAI